MQPTPLNARSAIASKRSVMEKIAEREADKGIGSRLVSLRGPLTQSAMGSKIGVSGAIVGKCERGERSLDPAMIAGLITAFDPWAVKWLLTGEGEMHPSEALAPERRATESAQPLDEELMGRVTDAISRLYKDEHVSLAPIDLGRLAGRKYSEIVAATDDPAERLAMLKLITVQLRAELHASAADPGTGKRSASAS